MRKRRTGEGTGVEAYERTATKRSKTEGGAEGKKKKKRRKMGLQELYDGGI